MTVIVRSTRMQWSPVLSHIGPPEIHRKIGMIIKIKKQFIYKSLKQEIKIQMSCMGRINK